MTAIYPPIKDTEQSIGHGIGYISRILLLRPIERSYQPMYTIGLQTFQPLQIVITQCDRVTVVGQSELIEIKTHHALMRCRALM